MKLLGLIINKNLSWEDNTDYICRKAQKKIWILRGMKKSGLNQSQLVDAYQKEVRSILELAVPVWGPGITSDQSIQIERVQKSSLAAILGSQYCSYESSLVKLNLQKLSERRENMCKKFILKNMKSGRPFFNFVQKQYDTRSAQNLVEEITCRTQKFYSSSLPYLARLYNENVRQNF